MLGVSLNNRGAKSSNRLFHGDNKVALDRLIDAEPESVRLIYIDPPFDTGLNWSTTGGDSAYSDKFKGDSYMEMMRAVLTRAHKLLTPDGSIFLHCDFRRSHHIAVLCDEIFGEGARGESAKAPGFRNEIVWLYGLGGSSPSWYPRKHDTIYWYTKGAKWHFVPPLIPATSNRLKGKLKKAPDWWEIPSLNNMSKERSGYPTQKPLALLERIIEAHSEVGDTVADLFCGSGTTLVAAEKLGRRWIGCDLGEQSLRVCRERLVSADYSVEMV
jgi:DNA modification methylase